MQLKNEIILQTLSWVPSMLEFEWTKGVNSVGGGRDFDGERDTGSGIESSHTHLLHMELKAMDTKPN